MKPQLSGSCFKLASIISYAAQGTKMTKNHNKLSINNLSIEHKSEQQPNSRNMYGHCNLCNGATRDPYCRSDVGQSFKSKDCFATQCWYTCMALEQGSAYMNAIRGLLIECARTYKRDEGKSNCGWRPAFEKRREPLHGTDTAPTSAAKLETRVVLCLLQTTKTDCASCTPKVHCKDYTVLPNRCSRGSLLQNFETLSTLELVAVELLWICSHPSLCRTDESLVYQNNCLPLH